MRTDLTFQPANDDFEHAFVSDADLLGFARPRDIVSDPVLTIGRKRQLLAYWASDIHAVRNFPALRSYAFGTTVSIDELRDAMDQLDERVDLPAIGGPHDASAAA
jgi:hypothetical protein